MRPARLLPLPLLALSLSACATIMHGTRQGVGIASTPTAATVTVNNVELGKTPLVADLRRKDNHTVTIALEGYHPYQTTLTRQTSGWVFGNLVFGMLPGLVVDAVSGGIYRLTPEQVQAQLSRPSTSSRDELRIFVTLAADPAWERLGTLTRTADRSPAPIMRNQ